MKTICMTLFACAFAFADPLVEVLAGLVDDAKTRGAVEKRLDALGPKAIPVLDKLYRSVRTDEAKRLVNRRLSAHGKEIRRRLLDGERRWFETEVRPLLADLSQDALWTLRLGKDGTLYFDAKTFDDPKRLRVLEYLVAPDDRKGYECFARMEPADWKEFKRAFSGGRPLRLRHIPWAMYTVPLGKVLPWARPVWHDHGMKIGGNHDESGNRALLSFEKHLQIGVVLG